MEGESLVFKVFPLNRVQQRRISLRNACLSGLWSRSLISPFLEEAFKIFAQDRVHPLLCTFQLVFMKSWMSPGERGFRTLPQNRKSAKLGPHSGSELSADFTSSPRQLTWTPGWLPIVGVRLGTTRSVSVSRRGAALRTAVAAFTGTCSPRTTPNGSLRGSAGRVGASDSVLQQVVEQFQFLDVVVQAVRGCRLSVMEAFRRMSSSTLPASSRCSHLEIWTLRLRPRFFQLVMVFGCCLWEYSEMDFSGDPACTSLGSTVYERLWTNFSIFYVAVSSDPETFGLHSF